MIQLLPHHIVNFADMVETGKDTTCITEYAVRGDGVRLRSQRILQLLLFDHKVRIKIIDNACKDAVCASEGVIREPNCTFLTNRHLSGCESRGHKRKEQEIASEMGIRVGKEYSFRELAERRDKTSWNKES
jgi:hypothetical protein